MTSGDFLFAVVGGIVGFSSKTTIDFLLSTSKDGFKDYKQLLAELLKNIETLSDQINKDIFSIYTGKHEEPARRHSILKLDNNLKHLGVQVNRVKNIISTRIKIDSNFGSELMEFRRDATRDIHNVGKDGSDAIDKLLDIHRRYMDFCDICLAIKSDLALYQLPDHFKHTSKKRWGARVS